MAKFGLELLCFATGNHSIWVLLLFQDASWAQAKSRGQVRRLVAVQSTEQSVDSVSAARSNFVACFFLLTFTPVQPILLLGRESLVAVLCVRRCRRDSCLGWLAHVCLLDFRQQLAHHSARCSSARRCCSRNAAQACAREQPRPALHADVRVWCELHILFAWRRASERVCRRWLVGKHLGPESVSERLSRRFLIVLVPTQ